MTNIISIVNQKGGVGKTTTTLNLAAYVGKKRKKVLFIDLDPQGNGTSGFGVDKGYIENSTYDVMVNDLPISEAIIESSAKNVDICPTNINLAGAEIELVSAMSTVIEVLIYIVNRSQSLIMQCRLRSKSANAILTAIKVRVCNVDCD